MDVGSVDGIGAFFDELPDLPCQCRFRAVPASRLDPALVLCHPYSSYPTGGHYVALHHHGRRVGPTESIRPPSKTNALGVASLDVRVGERSGDLSDVVQALIVTT